MIFITVKKLFNGIWTLQKTGQMFGFNMVLFQKKSELNSE